MTTQPDTIIDTADTADDDTIIDTADTAADDTTDTADTAADSTTDTDTADTAADDTPTPATPAKLTTAELVAQFHTAFVTAANGGDVSTAVDAYRLIPGGARGGALGTALARAIDAGCDSAAAVSLHAQVPALAASTPDRPVVDPEQVYRDRVAALILAIDLLPRPDGMADVTADGIRASVIVADASGLSDAIRGRANAAVAAVSRGGSGTRETVERLPLADLPDGDLQFQHRGTIHRASLVGGSIVVASTGESFTNPTRAAQSVNGGTSVNGWTAWHYTNADGTRGQSLHTAAAVTD